MFWRMVRGALFRQKGKMLMIAFTVALGASLATAMLNVMLDVGDKVNRELKAYGANILVVPRQTAVLNDLFGEQANSSAFLMESELAKIKTIFWAFNIVDFTPFLPVKVTVNGQPAPVEAVGTWFDHHMDLPTGETVDTGVVKMKSWWSVTGAWLKDKQNDAAMVGRELAARLGVKVGDRVTLAGSHAAETLRVVGVFDAGGDEDGKVFVNLAVAQKLSGKFGAVSSIEVSALTTPDNELSRRAARNPDSLSMQDRETWYCTAYVSSICYQIEEAIPECVAKAVRQVAESEGAILDKTQLLMLLITVLSMVGSALGISNLVTASVMERSKEIGLLKAIGARNVPVTLLVLTDILIVAICGGAVGYFAGIGFAQAIGHSVFSSSIDIKPMVIPIVAVLVVLVTLAGSLPSIRLLLSLRPAEVLHGGR